jgi:hypothetical protein
MKIRSTISAIAIVLSRSTPSTVSAGPIPLR